MEQSLWKYLEKSRKPVVLYGMGDGADKIIKVLESRGIEYRGVFATDGFVRDKYFHGLKLSSYSALKEKFGEECVKIRPDASVYSYPVITCAEAISHGGSFDNLCADVVRREDYSLEKKVRPAACPSFIWSTTTDSAVPVENSLLLYTALHKANVPVELHLFEKGPHGMSTCDGEVNWDEPSDPAYRHVKNWLPLSFEFLKEHGFAVRSEK